MCRQLGFCRQVSRPSQLAYPAMNASRQCARAAAHHRAFQQPCARGRSRQKRLQCFAASAASFDEYLSSAQQKLDNDNRRGALRDWEKALQDQECTDAQKRILLFNCASVYANNGDAELAQVPLRDALAFGLDFEAALQNPEEGMVRWRATQQVTISLKKFMQRLAAQEGTISKPIDPARGIKLTPAGIRTAMAEPDVGSILGTDLTGIDKSMVGIAKRVVLLLVVLSGTGLVLFYGGMKLAFPDGFS